LVLAADAPAPALGSQARRRTGRDWLKMKHSRLRDRCEARWKPPAVLRKRPAVLWKQSVVL